MRTRTIPADNAKAAEADITDEEWAQADASLREPGGRGR